MHDEAPNQIVRNGSAGVRQSGAGPGMGPAQTGNIRVNRVIWDNSVCHTYWYVYPGQGEVAENIWEGDGPPPPPPPPPPAIISTAEGVNGKVLKRSSKNRCQHLIKTSSGWRDKQLPDGTGTLVGCKLSDCRYHHLIPPMRALTKRSSGPSATGALPRWPGRYPRSGARTDVNRDHSSHRRSLMCWRASRDDVVLQLQRGWARYSLHSAEPRR